MFVHRIKTTNPNGHTYEYIFIFKLIIINKEIKFHVKILILTNKIKV